MSKAFISIWLSSLNSTVTDNIAFNLTFKVYLALGLKLTLQNLQNRTM